MKQPRSLAVILSTAILIVIAGFAAIVAALNGTVPPTPPPLEEKTSVTASPEMPVACKAQSDADFPACCEKDYQATGKLKPACVGEWRFLNNQCTWVCSTK
jgi:hypothetical protein